VEDGVTGLLIPPRQPDAVVSAIVATVTEPDRTAARAAKARQSVRNRFDSARLVQDTEAMYRETLLETRGGAAAVPSPVDGSSPSVQ
jgi:D-inositol-3-phosphate glycosyltransferase